MTGVLYSSILRENEILKFCNLRDFRAKQLCHLKKTKTNATISTVPVEYTVNRLRNSDVSKSNADGVCRLSATLFVNMYNYITVGLAGHVKTFAGQIEPMAKGIAESC